MASTSDQNTKNGIDDKFIIGDWVFMPAEKQLTNSSGETHPLEDKASDLLELLCVRRGDIVSREEIIEKVWQGRNLSEQTVPVAISKIRKALGEAGTDSKWLQTVPKRGYKIVLGDNVPAPSTPIAPQSKSWRSRAALLGIFAAAVFLITAFWPKATPLTPPVDANKPGIILTVKDIRTSLESQKDNGRVIALSELASFYLSQVPEVLVIRHWWNVDAPDPTGGIFTRYGADTPVYLLTGSLIEDAGELLVTLFLSDPRTDEVIWSGMHPVSNGSNDYFDTLGDMFATIGVIGTPQGRRSLIKAPTDNDLYWTARYMTQLSNENSATYAAELLGKMLEDQPNNEAAIQTVSALAARWQSISMPAMAGTPSQGDRSDHLAFVDDASIAFFQAGDIPAAHSLIDQALAIAPGDHYALSLKAEILVAENRIEEALNVYRKAIRLAPFARAYEKRVAEISPVVSE
ncbi:MAG: winged helix-turn-helix domain-containing protein [Kordiimonas sp.]